MKSWAWVAACAAGIAGCETTTLQRDGATENNSLGSYALPKASLNVAVFYARDGEADGLIVAAETPKIVAGEIVPLSAKFSGWSKDKYRVEVDPKTGLIKKITIGLDDRAPEIAKAAAESFAAVASLNPGFFARVGSNLPAQESPVIPKPDITQIAEITFDPTDAASVHDANHKLWSEIADYADIRAALDCRLEARRDQADQRTVQLAVEAAIGAKAKAAARKKKLEEIAARAPGATLCKQPDRLLPANVRGLGLERALPLLVTRHPLVQSPQAAVPASHAAGAAAPGSDMSATPAAPCSGLGTAGVCVRAVKEIPIALKAPAGPMRWRTTSLPAVGQESLVNIDRAIMADKSLDVDFILGAPGDREISQDSAAENIAKLPKTVIDAAVDSLGKTTTALSNIIPVRIEYRSLRRPDEGIEPPGDAAAADDGASESGAVKPAASTSAAQPSAMTATPTPMTSVSIPGANGATTITVTQATPPAKDETSKPPSTAPGPQLWFASCAYGLLCTGSLDDQLTQGSSLGAPELSQGETSSPARVRGGEKPPSQPQGASQSGQPANQNGGKPACRSAEDLAKPECRATTG